MPVKHESDQPAHMWSYWRNEKGYESAVRDYYPGALSKEDDVRRALNMIRDGKALLDRAFDVKEEEEAQPDE